MYQMLEGGEEPDSLGSLPVVACHSANFRKRGRWPGARAPPRRRARGAVRRRRDAQGRDVSRPTRDGDHLASGAALLQTAAGQLQVEVALHRTLSERGELRIVEDFTSVR